MDNFSPSVSKHQPYADKYFPSASTFTIRKAKFRDVDSITAILADSFHSRSGWCSWTYNLFRMGIYEDLRIRLRALDSSSICLVAVQSSHHHGDYLVGTVEITKRYHRSHQYPYIANLAVNQNYRRQGIAQKLLLSCEQTALEWGFEDIYLHVMENNQPARELYRQAGYHLHQVVPSWRHFIFKHPRKFFLHKKLSFTE